MNKEEALEFLKSTIQEMNAQDNRCTATPYYYQIQDFEAGWQAALEWQQKNSNKVAKYFAVVDSQEKYIQFDVRNHQLEIYEEYEFVPKFKNKKIIPVYISKHPPTALKV